jgi:MoxR-like ATPase
MDGQLSGNSPLRQRFAELQTELGACVVGQPQLVERLLIALLADGHLLVEGAPGLAKTTAIKELAARIEGDFQRIQFTPDLLPADLTGTDVFRPQDSRFEFQPGPLFHNLLLADEINRAPAKVQSALLEAMGERQVSVGRVTYALPSLFLVMATQNPIEQEGTYPLPEAQLDRFLMHVKIGYPEASTEVEILRLARERARHEGKASATMARITQADVFAARQEVLNLHFAPALERYLVELVLATRQLSDYGREFAPLIAFGASPRGSIALERCARAHAWLAGRDYVAPQDLHAIVQDVLRHRVLLSFQAEAENLDSGELVRRIVDCVPLP